MKVLHVIPSVATSDGGPSYAVRSMALGLKRLEVDVHIATTDADQPPGWHVPLGVAQEEEEATVWYFRRQTGFYKFSWPLTRWLSKHIADYDLAHIHALFSYATLPAALFAWRRGVPYVVRPLGTLNRWGMQNRRRILKRISFLMLERHILRHAALVHYTSEQEHLEASELGVEGPFVVIPPGVDLSAFTPLPPPGNFRNQYPELTGRTLILFLSRLDPVKGLDLLLPAFAQARQARPDVALALAGRGASEYEGRLQRWIRELGLQSDVLFTGFLESEQKMAALADCDLFVLPSYSESFGVAVVEAMACGKPVLISDQVAIHREVAQHDAGLVVPCAVDALASALLRLVDEPDLRDGLGRNGRRLAEERYALESVGEQLRQRYLEVLDRSAAGSQRTMHHGAQEIP